MDPTQYAAIKSISDPGKARVMMFANGQPAHAPMNAVTAASVHNATAKATPVDADEFGYYDSVSAGPVKATWANIKATLKTYFDTLYQPLAATLTSWAAITRATGFDAFVATPTSANLASLLTDETGTGAAVFANAPTISGVPVFSGIPSLTGGALSFPATQVASAGANDLDDYEEGTFTPTIVGTTTAGTGTYSGSGQIGVYVKVGRLVTYVIQLVWTAHTGTGNIQINGLPFSVATVVSPISIEVESLTFTGVPQGYASGTSISLFGAATGAAATGIAMDTAAAIRVSGFYYA